MLGWFTPYVYLGRAQRRMADRGSAVFTYHRIGPPGARSRDPFLYTTAGKLERDITRLTAAGIRIVSLGEMVDVKRTAAITFDDGLRSVFENALPVLVRHRVKAVQFIAAGMIGKRNEWDVEKGDVPEPMMDEAQIREWLAAGQEIGSHSMTHPNLKRLPIDRAREEIAASRKYLEDTFGVRVRFFCYPFGGWNPRVRDLVAEAGYESACTVEFGVNEPGTDRFLLRRIIPLSSMELVAKAAHRVRRRIL